MKISIVSLVLVSASTLAYAQDRAAVEEAGKKVRQVMAAHWEASHLRWVSGDCTYLCSQWMNRYEGRDENGRACELKIAMVDPVSLDDGYRTDYPYVVGYDFAGYSGSTAQMTNRRGPHIAWASIWAPGGGSKATLAHEEEQEYFDELLKSDPARHAQLFPEIGEGYFGMKGAWFSLTPTEYLGITSGKPHAYETNFLIFGPNGQPAYFIHAWQRAWTGYTPSRHVCKF
jgi:hypothetical protein